MARSQESQRQRTQNNPLVLGSFDTTSLKYLKGKLGPVNQLVGRADTNQQSNGGFGGGTYNHWFQVNLKKNAWIIVVKSGPRPNYIQTSVYNLDKNPIEGRGIFQADSVETTEGTETFYPYLGTVMGAQSDLFNTFIPAKLDRGDERYYPLSAGGYLLCISTIRNEPLDYEVGLVFEFPTTELFIATEDETDISLFLQETTIDFSKTLSILSPVTINTIISPDPNKPNGFTLLTCIINSGVILTVLENSEWLIGTEIEPDLSSGLPEFTILAEAGNDLFFDSIHDHSLAEWKKSWEATHQDTDKFPNVFVSLTNRI